MSDDNRIAEEIFDNAEEDLSISSFYEKRDKEQKETILEASRYKLFKPDNRPELPICKDCKWYIENRDSTHDVNLDYCFLSEREIISLVTGGIHLKYKYCTWMRSEDSRCGEQAKLFKLKPKEVVDSYEEENI